MNTSLKNWPNSPLHPAFMLSTWFFSGLLPKAPGTWGSLAALPFAWLLWTYGGYWAMALGIAGVFLLGLWATGKYMQLSGTQDPEEVVIDEVAGVWITCLALPLSPEIKDYVLAFILFRLFDILKPWPIRIFDRRHSAFGVMMDDVVAGIMAAAILWGVTQYV
ncbi:phosphatidylglycerophosphatase A family protein [Luteithermobacter gelatinilyticus]|uniref:phosphatidylglycerophosphatase A family protein n=1 Tax=Luteithermobacter gelatinilyticus TaxID=2582913 RepID=UPI001106CD24|nr:phosphatidylglycerophosphatase A [Luteithermobacter gelatinilyticus]